MTAKNKDDKIIPRQLADTFGLSLSTRYYCPSPTHQSNSPSYSLENNFCFSCKHKANDIVELIEGLQEANPKVFRNRAMSRSEIQKALASKSLPTEFVKTKSIQEIRKERDRRDVLISRLIASHTKSKSERLGHFDIDQSEYEVLISELGGNREYPQPEFPTPVYYQAGKKSSSIHLPAIDLQVGPDFIGGSFSPDSVILTTSITRVVEDSDELKSKKVFISAATEWLPSVIQDGISSGFVSSIEVDNDALFELVLGFCIENKVSLPEVTIIDSGRKIESVSKERLMSAFKMSSIEIPEGVNYLNINKPKDFDHVIEVGGKKIAMLDKIDKVSQSLIKTGAISLSDLFTGQRRTVSHNFKSDGSMISYALELLESQPKTVNIDKEIKLLKSLSPKQVESLDIQLKVAKAIKEMFPDEFWGIKGSANNLNILYLMGITSVNPAEVEELTPFSFLNPATNKNPDFDFELSPEQIERFLERYPEFTKGINETSKGDRIHVCKFFLNLEEEHRVYQTGEYIPVDSREIEKTSATPIDLLSSRVVTRINERKRASEFKSVPEQYRVSFNSLKKDSLPHFNDAVVRQVSRADQKKAFDTLELANMCSANRPIFYRTKLVLVDAEKKKHYFSLSTKVGFENIAALNSRSQELLDSGAITEEDLINFDAKKDTFAGMKIDYCKPNYMVKPPKWAIASEESILQSTNGVIRYQEQLMMLLSKYSSLKPMEIKDIVDKIAHPSKVEDESREDIPFNKDVPDAVIEQVNFVIKSPEAFFFKMGHALYLAETARQLSFYEEEVRGFSKGKDTENKKVAKQQTTNSLSH